jgi:putative ABC transport system substrate-binding protein
LFDTRDPNQVASTLSNLDKEKPEALIVTPAPLFTSQRTLIVNFVVNRHLPSMFFAREFVDAGGLMSYGPSFPDSYRRAALYVDKILKGAKPAELPVEQPTKFEFVITCKLPSKSGSQFRLTCWRAPIE